MRALVKTIPIAFLAVGVLSVPLFAANPDVPDSTNYGQEMPSPGALNYIEGTVHLQNELLNDKNVGNLSMEPGQVLTTLAGKAEILLDPGVFLRVGDYSAVKMISPDLTDTRVELLRGEAAVEVDETHKGNDLGVMDGNINIWLVQKGLYEFSAIPARVRVFKGLAAVQLYDGKYKKVKGSHEMYLMPGEMGKTPKFNPEDAQDDLYRWSEVRAKYEAEAYSQMGQEYDGWDGYGPGWYWDPYMMGYAFGGGPFWSPWGWGPGYYGGWGWGPGMGFYGGGFYPGYYGGFYGGGYYGGGFRGGDRFGGGLGAHGGDFGGRGFHGGQGGVGFHGGTFHGGGFGGFHGGGIGGGFHGGGGGFHGGGGGRR